jgi:PAS domain S-box-containing protein
MDRKKIIIVEDEMVSAESLRKSLVNLGYEVTSIVPSGEEAVKKAAEIHPDIIFMDINLSGQMDGIEAAATLQANYDIPVIFVSNYDNEEVLQRALVTSPYQYLIKPVNKVHLRNTIEIALNRHNLERLFKKHEKWLDILLGNTADAVIITDSNGTVLLMNSAAEKLTGWKHEESIGKDYTKIFNLKNEFEDISVENPIISALQFNFTVDFSDNTYLISKNGFNKYINGYAIPINSDTDEPDGVLLLVREIYEKNTDSADGKDKKNNLNTLILERTADLMKENVERKKAEKSLYTSEEKYRTIVETAQEGIWLSDYEFNTAFVNQKMAEMLGYSITELTSTQLFDYLEKKNKELFLREIKEKSIKTQYVKELSFKCKNGNILWAIVSTNLLFDDSGNRIGFLSMITDITERKLAEKEIVNAKLKAEESSRLKSVLMMNLNHELRTPMNGILGFASLLRDDNLNSAQTQMIDDIYYSGNRLMNTLNSIMEFAALESGYTKPKISEFNLLEYLEQTVGNFEKIAKEKELNYYINIKRNDIFVKSDVEMVKTIVSNIIDNAIKYTTKGSVKIEIDRIAEGSENFALLSISDTGIGIPEDKLNEVFKEFKQASEGVGRNYEGLGLGLTIAKKMADLTGVKINVISEYMGGSVFTLKIPSAYTKENEIVVKSTGSADETRKSAKVKQTNGLQEILIVEDNIINVHLIIIYLKNKYQADYALSGEKAIEMAGKKKYSLILTDINLGTGINGIETQKRIRKLEGYQNIPNIAVTGYSTKEDKHQFLKEGFDGFLPKPFTKELLIHTTEQLINRK